jgi:hypothetical protein
MNIGEEVPMSEETFTLWLNADGQPIEKRLCEMTRDEVLSTLKWYDEHEASEKTRFRRQVRAAMPQWSGERLTLAQAVRAYWPPRAGRSALQVGRA